MSQARQALRLRRTGDATQANVYNGLDDRVTVTSGSTTRRFVYGMDGRVLAEYGTSATNVIAEHIWWSPEAANDNDQLPVGGDDGAGGYAPLAIVAGSTVSWVHGSHLGVPLVYTNSIGAAIATPAHTVSGFPGQLRTLADLYYNRYRDYDSSTGRYIQADPIGLEGGANVYAYAENNPLRYVDPKGLEAATWGSLGGNIGSLFGPFGEAIGGGIGSAFDSPASSQCPVPKKCPPCRTVSGRVVPIGTIGYRFDRVPPSRPHRPLPGDHYNLLQAHQNPNNCRCFWQPLKQATEIAPPGSISVEDFAN